MDSGKKVGVKKNSRGYSSWKKEIQIVLIHTFFFEIQPKSKNKSKNKSRTIRG